MAQAIAKGWNEYIDETWLRQVQEDVIDPDMPIVDPHHHLWSTPFSYEAPQLINDLHSGHNVIATVYAEAHRGYRTDGPEHLKPVGETELVVELAEASEEAGSPARICAGITGAADLTASEPLVNEVLDAHIVAGKGRFSGIRANIFVTFHPVTLEMIRIPGWESVVDQPAFLTGVRCLARRGLTLDLVCTDSSLGHVARLAKHVPEAVIVLDHLAPIVDFSDDPASESDHLARWRQGIDVVARHPNVHMKLGGCANPMMAQSMPEFLALRGRPQPPNSAELAEIYRPTISYAIEQFGPSRCMFESNFPVDKSSVSYNILWNAFKKLAAPYTEMERRALFMTTAARVYGLRGLPVNQN